MRDASRSKPPTLNAAVEIAVPAVATSKKTVIRCFAFLILFLYYLASFPSHKNYQKHLLLATYITGNLPTTTDSFNLSIPKK